MSDFSLMPQEESRLNKLPISAATAKALILCAVLLVGLFVANGYVGDKESSAKADLANAQADQKQVQMQTMRLRTQLSAIQASGGSGRRNLAKSLLAARVDWQPIILALIRSAPVGTYYTGGFTGQAPASTTSSTSAATAGSAFTMPLAGTSPSRAELEKLVQNLRRQRIGKKPVFLNVILNSITATTPTGPQAGAAAPGAKTDAKLTWALTLNLAPPPAMPSAGSTTPSGSSPSGSSNQGGKP